MSNRVFGVVWCLIIAVLSLLPLLHNEPVRATFAVVAAMVALIAIAAPNLLAWPNTIWTRFGKISHAITSAVALFVVYFFFITPGAALLRLCGRSQLKLRFDPETPSYWTERPKDETNFKLPY